MRDHAAQLVPAIRTVLRRTPLDTGQFLRALAAWATASVEAMPELIALLDTAHAARSCVVLGRIGPDARAAADVLEQLALGRRRPPPARDLHPAAVWHATQDAGRAHWQMTGDPGVAGAVLGRAVRCGLGKPVLPHLAHLGPLAAGYAQDVRHLLDLPGDWSRIEAAHAWWRITGDPTLATPVLIAAVQPLP